MALSLAGALARLAQGELGRRERQAEAARQDTLAARVAALDALNRENIQDQIRTRKQDDLRQEYESQARIKALGQPREQAPRNIDPLSREGIAAATEREKALADVRPQSPSSRNIDPLSPEGIKARLAMERSLQAIPSRGQSQIKPPKAPTEAQEKSYLFHGLMVTGQQDMANALASGKVRPEAITAALKTPDALDFATNAFLTPEEQQYMLGLRNITAGVLRKETGAGFGKGELSQTYARMGDMMGDAPQTAAAKKAARQQYIDLMEQSARPATMYYEAVKGNGVPRITAEEEAAGGTGEFAPKPLSPQDAAHAARNPKFAAWLKSKGYAVPE